MTLRRSAHKPLWLVLIAAMAVACSAALEDPLAKAQTQPEGAFIDLPEGRVHAIIRGRGPDLIMIHGANGNARDFSFDLIDRLSGQFRVIAVDRPGFGFSDDFGGLESPLQQAEVLRDAMAAIGVERPLVVGHSYGGAVALAWALQAPDHVAGLTLFAPVTHPWPGNLGLWYQISGSVFGQKVVVPLVSAFATRDRVARPLKSVFAPDPVPEGYLDHLGVDLTTRRAQLMLNARQVTTLKGYVDAMMHGYAALEMPIEIVHGDKDKTVGLHIHGQRFIQDVTSARLTILEGVGHMPHHARPKAAVDAIHRTARRAQP